jgi:hypothetical protein
MESQYGVQRPPSTPCSRPLKPCRYIQSHPRGVGSANVSLFCRYSFRMRRASAISPSLCRKRSKCSSHRPQHLYRHIFRPNSNLESTATSRTLHTTSSSMSRSCSIGTWRVFEQVRPSGRKMKRTYRDACSMLNGLRRSSRVLWKRFIRRISASSYEVSISSMTLPR